MSSSAKYQITMLRHLQQRHAPTAEKVLAKLQEVAINNGNLFAEMMDTVKFCSLGQITHALFKVGGQYRRNM